MQTCSVLKRDIYDTGIHTYKSSWTLIPGSEVNIITPRPVFLKSLSASRCLTIVREGARKILAEATKANIFFAIQKNKV